MKKIAFLVIFSISLSSIGLSQSFWNQQTSNTTNNLRHVLFTNSSTGYIAGNSGTILKTINGGTNWNPLTSSTTNDLYSVSFPSVNIGYVVGRFETIRKTTNGGTTWILKNIGINNYNIHFSDVFFINNLVGCAVGNGYNGNTNGYIVRTADGGENWTIISSGSVPSNSIYFSSSNIGYVVGNNGSWSKTTDGGLNWVLQSQISISYGVHPDLASVYFLNDNLGYAAGCSYSSGTYNYVIAKTTNGGTNWTTQTFSGSSSAYNFYSIFFPSQDTGYVVGAGYLTGEIMKTYNSSSDWSLQHCNFNTGLLSTYFTDNNTGYAVGTGGIILKTTNGGCNISIPGTPTGIDTLCKNPPNTIYTTTGASNTTSYLWSLVPWITAGQFVGGSPPLSATVDWTNTYSGTATIKVKGHSDYCDGPISNPLIVTIFPNAPLQAGTPTGPTSLCINNANTTYTTVGATYATSYIWSISPSGAGIISGNGLSAVVDWNNTYTGSAQINVKGTNICGDGAVSPSLSITVTPIPSNAGTISGATTVCQGQNSVVYTVPVIANATSYIWTLPPGATGTSSTNSITVNFGTTAVSGSITVKGHNYCGDGVASSLAIIVNPLPANAGTITGATTVCQGQNSAVYTVPVIANAISYIWTLPTGASGTSSTNTITVNFSITAVSGSITVKGHNSCGDGVISSLAIAVNPLPANAGTISGPTAVCQGQNSVVYTVPVIANATSYIWSLPPGATGTSSTNSITVNYATSAVSGNITVYGHNSCGDGVVSTLSIIVNPLPSNAGTISGATTVCQGQNSVVYTVPVITNATSYIWTLPTGATGTSSTNSISVNYGTSAVSGNITVKGHNSCGDGVLSSLAITVNPLPANAGTISGTTTVCQGQNSVDYTVPVIANATSYIWSLPPGATGTSSTNSITVNYSTSAISGNIAVKGHNSCGDGIESTLAITVNQVPADAGTILGPTTVCQGQNSVVYTVPLIANATSYIWSLPPGAIGTSSTNSISVNFGISAGSGVITVKGNNSCGDGGISTLFITVNIKPATPVITINGSVLYSDAAIGNQWYNQNGLIFGATSQSYTPVINGDYYVIVTINGCSSDPSNSINVVTIGIEQINLNKSIKVYPNPVSNELVIDFVGNKEVIDFEIFNSIGQLVFKGNFSETIVVQTTDFNPGVYLLKFENSKTVEFKKIIKE